MAALPYPALTPSPNLPYASSSTSPGAPEKEPSRLQSRRPTTPPRSGNQGGDLVTLDKSFRCVPCQRGFTTNRALLRHHRENQNHRLVDGHVCPKCSTHFARGNDPNRHSKKRDVQGKTACQRKQKAEREGSRHDGRVLAKYDNPENSAMKVQRLWDAPDLPIAEQRDSYSPATSVEWTYSSFEPISHSKHEADPACERKGRASREWTPEVSSATNDARLFINEMLEDIDLINTGLALRSHISYGERDRLVVSTIPAIVFERETRLAIEHCSTRCGLCHKAFERYTRKELLEHLNGHLSELQTPTHFCEQCSTGHAEIQDLEMHLRSASKGSCGFGFPHKTPCTGHHSISTDDHEGWHKEAARSDRNSFLERIRNWELSQLQSFLRTVSSIVDTTKAPGSVCGQTTISDPFPMGVVPSIGSPGDTSYHQVSSPDHTDSTSPATSCRLAELQHQISLKSLALQTLQQEYATLLQKLQRERIKSQTVEKKTTVADCEINDLYKQISGLERQLQDCEQKRKNGRAEVTKARGAWSLAGPGKYLWRRGFLNFSTWRWKSRRLTCYVETTSV